jgi:hypothetical protein
MSDVRFLAGSTPQIMALTPQLGTVATARGSITGRHPNQIEQSAGAGLNPRS